MLQSPYFIQRRNSYRTSRHVYNSQVVGATLLVVVLICEHQGLREITQTSMEQKEQSYH
jgi:hypothetical protein